jgi:hypothetical protein
MEDQLRSKTTDKRPRQTPEPSIQGSGLWTLFGLAGLRENAKQILEKISDSFPFSALVHTSALNRATSKRLPTKEVDDETRNCAEMITCSMLSGKSQKNRPFCQQAKTDRS